MKTIRYSILLGILSLAASPAQVYTPQGGSNQPKPARPEVDPFADTDPKSNGSEPDAPKDATTLSVRYETFSLDLTTAAGLQRETLNDAALYSRVVAMTGKKEARQESLTVIRTLGGKRVKSESAAEMIYAMEYEPPELPNTIGVSITPPKGGPDDQTPATVPDTKKLEGAPALEELPAFQTPAMPSAWQTRNTGITLEVEATIVPSGAIELNLLVQHVTRAGSSEYGQGLSKVTMPDFENQEIAASFTVQPDKTAFVGTINRPSVSKADPESANRVWFAFVTASPVKP